MNDVHEYFDENNVKWNRVFTVPKVNIDTKLDPFSAQDFVRKTANHKGTLGDLFDMSRDMAEKRKDKDGIDVIKEKEIKKYKQETGLKHVGEVS